MTFADKMRDWMPLHQNGVSRAVHFIGGFLFVFAVLVPLGWLRFEIAGARLTAAMLAAAILAIYAITLEPTAGIGMAILLAPTLYAAGLVSGLPVQTGLWIAVGTMVFRFAAVITAHVAFEKKTHGLSLGGPVLFVVEPVYLLTLALFSLGMKQDLRARVATRRADEALG